MFLAWQATIAMGLKNKDLIGGKGGTRGTAHFIECSLTRTGTCEVQCYIKEDTSVAIAVALRRSTKSYRICS
jgi:hypothetical protein